MKCSHCSRETTKQNGPRHYGKQNYFCPDFQRQFVEGGQKWFVSDSDKSKINKLLLERISLAGICRVCDVSQQWLLRYIKELYDHLPADLTLADRIEEEIGRIEAIKKFDFITGVY
jgi:transposase-like protein